MKAVILAAGTGTKVMPLTENIPKVLISVGNKPLLSKSISVLRESGIDEIGIVVGYKKEKIKEFIHRENLKNITLIEQPKISGTANAVQVSKDFVGKDNFLVIMGDNLYSPNDLKDILSYNKNCIGAIKMDVGGNYGKVLHDDWKLKEIAENTSKTDSNLINVGAYLFTPKIFSACDGLFMKAICTVPASVKSIARFSPAAL
ncbi:MAG: Glucose-1-phosphate thymidylyltransferase [Candidatus Woesebacteria bacterium GW2011_GWB1_38_5b]|uniref:Glucose-1-phosphate thymidylyltransferase n=1 Tax=Candidatus Woesebacteria bacterium GW2011_GWB1_38_5b TaxID=1618569 RepID=A0A0G0KJK6_9BACT|nr:MAG: Glucose-1-phosphate thymidylyltransferase [Candidatus Woesebacteria bacterium GW2011_GWB1_38_5b]